MEHLYRRVKSGRVMGGKWEEKWEKGEKGRNERGGEKAQREREGEMQPMRRKGEKKQIDGPV